MWEKLGILKRKALLKNIMQENNVPPKFLRHKSTIKAAQSYVKKYSSIQM
jgi:hypothetical protein